MDFSNNRDDIVILSKTAFVCLDIIASHPEITLVLSSVQTEQILNDIISLKYEELTIKYPIKIDIQTQFILRNYCKKVQVLSTETKNKATELLKKINTCDEKFLKDLNKVLANEKQITKVAAFNNTQRAIKDIAAENDFDLGQACIPSNDNIKHLHSSRINHGYGGYGYGYGGYGYGYGGYGYGYGGYGYGYGGYGYGYGGYGYGYGNYSYDKSNINNDKKQIFINKAQPNIWHINFNDHNSLKIHQYLWRGICNAEGDTIRLKENEYLSSEQIQSILFRIPKATGEDEPEKIFRAIAHVANDPNVYNKMIISARNPKK